MKWLLATLIGLAFAAMPGFAFAQDGEGDDVLIRINGDVRVASGETVGSVIVIDGDAVIEGTVTESVVVISGNAVISGSVANEVTVISGDVDLRSGATVKNVTSIDGDVIRASGATVTGDIDERDRIAFPTAVAAVVSLLFWVALTIAVLVAGVIFALVGGRQLREAARMTTGDAVNTILGFVFVWFAIPAIALLAMITLIGLPLGLGLLIFLLPALWFLGYIVAGARLGSFLLARIGQETGQRPVSATILGLALLQAIALLPFFGALVAIIAGAWGAGALAFLAFRAAGGRGFAGGAPAAPPQPEAAA